MKNQTKFSELYSDSVYEKPSVTVDAVIFRLADQENSNYRKLPQKKLQVFLIKREFAPFAGAYAVPGTFIDLNFELSESVKNCVEKKADLKHYYSEQLYSFGAKSRDPRDRVISISYMLLTNSEETLAHGEWFDVDVSFSKFNATEQTVTLTLTNGKTVLKNAFRLPLTQNNISQFNSFTTVSSALAFDHAQIILYALERLKNKLEYTDIVFHLLPQKFSLTELKLAYESILQQKLLDANFRRKIIKYISPTEDYILGKGHRSSRLYAHNPDWHKLNLD